MCYDCLKLQVNITIAKTGDIVQCGKCERWHVRQDQWIHHETESTGLLALCLKRLSGLEKTKLLDAGWLWTEPHSKRLKVWVDVEVSVLHDKICVRQRSTIEFTVRNKQCLECIRESTDHSWGALVQIRQRVAHKRSLYFLEQELTKSGLHNLILSVENSKDGLDLYFKAKNQSEKIIEFLSSLYPVKTKHSKKLVSSNQQSNTHKYEYTSVIEIPAVSKDDLVLIDAGSKKQKELYLVLKLSSSIHLINPCRMEKLEISASRYFMKPFHAVLTATKHLSRFIVLNIEVVNEQLGDGRGGNQRRGRRNTYTQPFYQKRSFLILHQLSELYTNSK